MTRKATLCENFLERAGLEPRQTPDQLHNLCPRCLKGSGLELPKKYADLGGLAKCSVCGEIADCRDYELLTRCARAKVDPSTVYLKFPRLRRPLNGLNITIEVIDALILAQKGSDH